MLPVAKFTDAGPLVSQFDKHHPLRVSALGPKTEHAKDFLAELERPLKRFVRFRNNTPTWSRSPS
jgi:hypothetical protein